jgi:hypothetical protein
MAREIQIVSIDPFAGRKNLTFCEGKGPDDPKCLEKNPPKGKQIIFGHVCGAGCDKFGTCKVVFANPEEHPDLFELIG